MNCWGMSFPSVGIKATLRPLDDLKDIRKKELGEDLVPSCNMHTHTHTHTHTLYPYLYIYIIYIYIYYMYIYIYGECMNLGVLPQSLPITTNKSDTLRGLRRGLRRSALGGNTGVNWWHRGQRHETWQRHRGPRGRRLDMSS